MSGAVELLAQAEIGQDSADLLAQVEVRQGSAELLSNFRVACPRLMGGNWQRKMWFDGTYYWRGRYDPVGDELIFEYIAAAGLAGNVWTKNAAASIDASGFTGLDADFTVRPPHGYGISVTIHYSDGVDSWIAESDEASLTGWAWQNLTMLFDGTAPDHYWEVNLAANRTTPTPRLWAIAVFYDDDPDGKQWVKARRQTKGGDITDWDAEVDISNVDNTDAVWGCCLRSMGVAGVLKSDMMVVYKEGGALRSRYYNGTWQAIQDIDTTTLPVKGAWDFEHGELLGVDMGHVLYVDADRSIKWRERDAGAAEVWSAAEQLHAADASHRGVGIVEHGSGWLWTIWVHGNDIEYRLHQCVPEVWYPLLAADPLVFDVFNEGIINTSTIAQPHTPDLIPSGESVPICWIGETAPATPCAAGWGILIEYSIGSLYAKAEIRNVASAELYARLEVGQGSAELLGRFEAQASAELLGKAVIRHVGIPVEFLGKAVIRHVGIPVEFLGRFEAQASAELLGKAVIRHVGIPVEFLDKAVIRHVGIPVEFLGRFEAQASAELPANAVVRHVGTPIEFLGRFEAQASAELFGKFEIGQDSAELLVRFDLGQGSAELYARGEVGQNSIDLLGRSIIRQVGLPLELPARFEIRHIGVPVELLGKGVIKNVGSAEAYAYLIVRNIGSSELLGRTVIRHEDLVEVYIHLIVKNASSAEAYGHLIVRNIGSAEAYGHLIVRNIGSAELPSDAIIRHSDIEGLLARCVIRHSATKDLDANVEIIHWEDLYCKSIIRHTATPLNLPAIFWTRFPRRLWTSRRYINGVIDLDEKLLGDAILEYVIEGVMEDTQGYLDNAGLSYSEWTDITLVPVQILRAVTYGTVAALYARHTQTFRSQVIPSVTPVTVTVIGDAEKAMNYWEDRMDQMLEFYVTSQGGDVMLTSTPDQEPVFSMEDIPEEVTEFVSWRIWLQQREN